MLLVLGRPDQALVEYEASLRVVPNRFNGLYGAAQAAELAGNRQKAATYYAQLLAVCEGADTERPEAQHARLYLAENRLSEGKTTARARLAIWDDTINRRDFL